MLDLKFYYLPGGKNIGKPRKTFLGRLEYLGFCEKPAKTKVGKNLIFHP